MCQHCTQAASAHKRLQNMTRCKSKQVTTHLTNAFGRRNYKWHAKVHRPDDNKITVNSRKSKLHTECSESFKKKQCGGDKQIHLDILLPS